MHHAYIKCISCQCDRDWGTMFPLCGAQCGQGQQPLVWAWQTAWGFLKYRVQRQIWGEFGETNAHSPCCMGSMLVGGGGSPLIKKIRLNGLQEEKLCFLPITHSDCRGGTSREHGAQSYHQVPVWRWMWVPKALWDRPEHLYHHHHYFHYYYCSY